MIEEIHSQEQRLSARMVLRRAITYEPSALPKSPHLPTGKALRAYLLNVSNGGLCFKTRHQLQTRAVLKINLPLNQISPVAPTLAQVRWVRRDPKRKEYRTGLKFII